MHYWYFNVENANVSILVSFSQHLINNLTYFEPTLWTLRNKYYSIKLKIFIPINYLIMYQLIYPVLNIIINPLSFPINLINIVLEPEVYNSILLDNYCGWFPNLTTDSQLLHYSFYGVGSMIYQWVRSEDVVPYSLLTL